MSNTTVLREELHLGLGQRLALPNDPIEPLFDLRTVVGVDELEDRLPHQFRRVVGVHHSDAGVVDVDQGSVGVEQRDRRRINVDQGSIAAFAPIGVGSGSVPIDYALDPVREYRVPTLRSRFSEVFVGPERERLARDPLGVLAGDENEREVPVTIPDDP